MLRKSSLKVRLWVVVSLAILPLVLFSFFDFQAQRKHAAADIEQDLQVILRAAKAEEAAAVMQVRQIFRIMAASSELRQFDPAECNGISTRMLGTLEDLSNIGAVTPAGDVFCSAMPFKAPVNASDRGWFKSALAQPGMSPGEFIIGRISGQPGVTFGYPLLNDAGKLRSVLFIASKVSWFDRMVSNIKLPPGWEATLLTRDGLIVTHYPDPDQWRDRQVDPETLRALKEVGLDRDQVLEVTGFDGTRRMVGVAPMLSSQGSLKVLISAPIGVSYAAVAQYFYQQLVLLALIAGLSLVVARVYVFRLVEVWAARLASGAQRIADGRFGERLAALSGSRELDQVVLAFNTMAAALEKREAAQAAAEASLRASQEQLALVLRGSNDGWWDYDLAQQHLQYSERWLQMLGYAPGELAESAGMWLELLHPEDLERVQGALQKLLAGTADAYEIEFRLRHKDGHYVPLLSRGYLTRDAGGKAIRLTGSNMDLSQLKAQDAELRKLSLAVEQSPASIVITDRHARIIYASPAFKRVTGYTDEEVLGQNPRILQSGKTTHETYESLWSTLAQGQVWRGELFNRRKDGSEYVEQAMISPVRQANGEITHYLAIKEDVTEQKRVAIELENYRLHLEHMVSQRTDELAEATAAAERANLAKSSFLANMSHEIRTPMNAITGFAHLLGAGQLDDSQREKLGKITRATQHLLRIINDILDLSKIEAGKLVLESRRFSPDEVINTVGTMVRHSAAEKSVAVDIVCADLPERVLGDETRLRQALLNFASNAVKFTQHGRITLRGEVMRHETSEDSEDSTCLLKFSVTDTGIGIPADALPRLFQPFEQADVSTTRQHGGTGLGLSISRYLAELMGGEVGVESEVGQGSTFWLTARFAAVAVEAKAMLLPLAQISSRAAQLSSANALESLRERRSTAHVLLVEDEAINREVGKGMLEAAGITVDLAADGRQAIDQAMTNRYDLILMDIQMPVMDGLEATRALRALPDYQQIPVIALTASAFAADQTACLEAGMNDFVAKPILPEVFYAALLRWLTPALDAAPVILPATTDSAPDLMRPTVSPDLQEQLHQLLDLLQTGNEAASQRFQQLQSALNHAGLADLKPLASAIARYDYSAAAALLEAWLQALDNTATRRME